MTEKTMAISFIPGKTRAAFPAIHHFGAKISRHLQPLRGVSGCTVGPGGGVLKYPLTLVNLLSNHRTQGFATGKITAQYC